LGQPSFPSFPPLHPLFFLPFPAMAPSEAFSAMVAFDVFLVSGRTGTISCEGEEDLRGLLPRIATELELGDGVEVPLLEFFRPSCSKVGSPRGELLPWSTCAQAIAGSNIHVVLLEHPDWCAQRCFLRRSGADLSWDVEEETTEWLSFFMDGQFTYEKRRFSWDEGTDGGPMCVRQEEVRGTGTWRCVLKAISGSTSMEEVLVMEGSWQLQQFETSGVCPSRMSPMRLVIPRGRLEEYEVSALP